MPIETIEIRGEPIEFNFTNEQDLLAQVEAADTAIAQQGLPQQQLPQQQFGAGEAALRGGLAGLTLGTSRDIGADVAAFGLGIADIFGLAPEELEGKTFLELQQLARKESREKEAQLREQQPVAFGLGEVAGAIGLPVGAGARGIKQLAGLGAATGGVVAAGQTTQSPFEDPIAFGEEVLTGAGIGGLVGGAVGGVFGGIANKMAKKAADRGLTREEGVIVNALRREGFADDQIANFAREAGKGEVPRTIGELADSTALLGRQKRLAQAAGEAGDVFKEFNEARTDVIRNTVDRFIKDDISKTISATRAGKKAVTASQKAFEKLTKRRADKASPLYEAAFQKTVDIDAVNELLSDPIIRKSVESVKRNPAFQADLAKFSDNSIGVFDRAKQKINNQIKTFLSTGNIEEATPLINVKNQLDNALKRGDVKEARILIGEKFPRIENNIALFDRAKQDIDDLIGRAIKSGEKNKARLLQKSKNLLTSNLDNISPEYSLARQTFEKGSQPIDKLSDSIVGSIADLKKGNFAKAGNKFFSEPNTDIKFASTVLRKIDPEAADGLVASKMTELMDKSSSLPVFLNKVANNKFILKKWQASMTPKQFKGFNRLMEEVRQATKVKFGSDTATNQQIDALLSAELGAPLAGISGRVTLRQQVEDRAEQLLRGIADRFQNRRFEELSRIMTGENAEQLVDKLSNIKKGTPKSLQIITDFLSEQASAPQVRALSVETVDGVMNGEE